MPVHEPIAAQASEAAQWRRDFHAHPELGFDEHRTAGIVADKLRAFGCDEVVTGIATTGVVGVIRGARPGSERVVGLRADMDALPIEEATNLPWRSTNPGRMHACGHDGHTAMLLAGARHLAATRDFSGTAVVIFQPAEEGGGGAAVMLNEGLLERFGVQEVYGMHNMPGIPVGAFAIRPGPMMAAADRFKLVIEGNGAHAAKPHAGIDPILVASHVVVALQSIVARNVDPLSSAVVTVGSLKAGDTFNVIPQTATMLGTVRTLTEEVRELCEARVRGVVENVCKALGAGVEIEYVRGYPVTRNHPAEAAFAAAMAREVSGHEAVDADTLPLMGAEAFSVMLEKRPGAYIFVGNGDTAGVHNPAYDFNDDALAVGASFWARLVEGGAGKAA